MKITNRGLNEFDAPWIAEDLVSLMSLSDDDLNKDWETTEVMEDGLKVTYGVKNKKSYAYFIEDNLEDLLLACKYFRDNEMNLLDRMNSGSNRDYTISKGLRLELMARGIPVDAIVQSGDAKAWEDIDYIIETEFPEFKLTNRTLVLKKSKKKDKK